LAQGRKLLVLSRREVPSRYVHWSQSDKLLVPGQCGWQAVAVMPKSTKNRKRRKRVVPRPQSERICSEALSMFLSNGQSRRLTLTSGEAVKRLWAKAKVSGLQRGRTIQCNAAMVRLFDRSELGMCDVPSALAAHMTGTSSHSRAPARASCAAASASSSSRAAEGLPGPCSDTTLPRSCAAVSPAALRAAARETTLLTLSAGLTALLFGDEHGATARWEATMTEAEALKRLGRYISRHELRHPTDRRTIRCNAALAEIVGKSSFSVYEAKQLLARHIVSRRVESASDDISAGASSSTTSATGGGGRAGGAAAGGSDGSGGVGESRGDTGDKDISGGIGTSTGPSGCSRQMRADESSAASVRSTGDQGGCSNQRIDAATPREADTPPHEYVCPITLNVMIDPVCTVDGQCFERAAIERWLRVNRTSPLTGAALESTVVIPNIPLRKLCTEWRATRPLTS